MIGFRWARYAAASAFVITTFTMIRGAIHGWLAPGTYVSEQLLPHLTPQQATAHGVLGGILVGVAAGLLASFFLGPLFGLLIDAALAGEEKKQYE